MAAQQMGQQQVARGGEIAVDPAALAEATALLEECQRACGGQASRDAGGRTVAPNHEAIPYTGPNVRQEAQRLLALWDRIDRDNPNINSSRRPTWSAAHLGLPDT